VVLPSQVDLNCLKSYLIGAMHDGTVRKRTLRISQKEEEYVLLLKELILGAGGRAWTYREGKDRNLYIVEFSRAFLEGHEFRSRRERVHYIRGYFDAEGAVASPSAPDPYVNLHRKTDSTWSAFAGYSDNQGSLAGKSTILVAGLIPTTGASSYRANPSCDSPT